ncbi:DUF222 domain-containing protein [Leekyejoonella antrihumi]|nr:DUF222 domain-containing protein [Leekyejoonella antrihumi]
MEFRDDDQQPRRGDAFTPPDSGSPRQWLTDRAPHLEPGQASRIVTAADAINQPRNAPVRAALDAGEISTRALIVALREVDKAHPVLPGASRLQVLGYYLAVAHDGTSADLKAVTERIVAVFADEKAPVDEVKARTMESLRWHDLPGGMTRIEGELSPGNAAIFASAIETLASPRHTNHTDTHTSTDTGDVTNHDDVEDPAPADLGSPGKRRADAVGGGTPARSEARRGKTGPHPGARPTTRSLVGRWPQRPNPMGRCCAHDITT